MDIHGMYLDQNTGQPRILTQIDKELKKPSILTQKDKEHSVGRSSPDEENHNN